MHVLSNKLLKVTLPNTIHVIGNNVASPHVFCQVKGLLHREDASNDAAMRLTEKLFILHTQRSSVKELLHRSTDRSLCERTFSQVSFEV